MKANIEFILENYNIDGNVISFEPFGNGHINDTRLLEVSGKDGIRAKYVVQRINKNVFTQPDKLMENYVAVTDYLRQIVAKQGGDVDREVVRVIYTKTGKSYAVDPSGEYWRVITCIENSMSYDKVERPVQFYDSAVAFGNFQYMLRDFPADTLHETIANFHNTPVRYSNFMRAVSEDAVDRAKNVQAEIKFVCDRCDFSATLEKAHDEGRLPLRVTHNDTKLNNILFDVETGKALCVVDLDTIMPGYSVNDFGDSIRFGASTALEDETDLSKVNFDIELYELYTKGFIEGANGGLTEAELELLPYGAMMMTFECGMRFLTDYLSGDTYFRIHRPDHNLDRARNQFKLLTDMEARLDEMKDIVKKYS